MPRIILHDLAEVEELLLLVLGPLRQRIGHQHVVGGRCDFGGEGRIVRQLVRLRRLSQQRVHRVAPFVRINAEAIIFVAHVEEQVRVHAISVGLHIGARRFSRPWERIHPPFRARIGKDSDIFGPERPHRLDRQLTDLGQSIASVRLHQRRINVPITHVGQAEHPPAKLEIAVEDWKPAIGFGDQRPVDRFGQVGAVERALNRAIIFARLGGELVAIDLRRKRGAERTFEALCSLPRKSRRPFCGRPGWARHGPVCSPGRRGELLCRR